MVGNNSKPNFIPDKRFGNRSEGNVEKKWLRFTNRFNANRRFMFLFRRTRKRNPRYFQFSFFKLQHTPIAPASLAPNATAVPCSPARTCTCQNPCFAIQHDRCSGIVTATRVVYPRQHRTCRAHAHEPLVVPHRPSATPHAGDSDSLHFLVSLSRLPKTNHQHVLLPRLVAPPPPPSCKTCTSCHPSSVVTVKRVSSDHGSQSNDSIPAWGLSPVSTQD